MNRNKRQIRTNDDANVKKKKVQCTSPCIPITSNIYSNAITRLENLSNELIYEAFEYLDTYQLHEGFFDLNIRFRTLCMESNLPINIQVSSLPRSSFQRCYTHMIMHKKHRIHSLHSSNPFIMDFFYSQTEAITKCSQLQTLVLDQIPSEHMEKLLIDLASLSNLSSLAISLNLSTNNGSIWKLIFQLPYLTYCKISYEANAYIGFLPLSSSTPSPIRHLIIHGELDYTQVNALLSYVPRLRRLAIHSLYGYNRHGVGVSSLSVLKHLTHVSLTLNQLLFEQFEPFIKQYFSQVRVLYITSNYDTKYVDANHWENLILNYVPYLRIFDIQYSYGLYNRFKHEIWYQNTYEKFKSSFWIERKWFFAFKSNYVGTLPGIFCSVQPYRRKSYTLIDESNSSDICSDLEKTIFSSVKHVIIQDERMIGNCSKYFPNANELTISDQRTDRSRRYATVSIDHILFVDRLTKVTIDYNYRPFSKILDLLFCAPNVHTLVLKRVTIVSTDYSPLQQTDRFRLVSTQNKIKDLTILFDYSLRNIQLLMNLCPKLQQLSVGTSDSCLESTIQFLLSKARKTTCDLSAISISGTNTVVDDEVKVLIESEKLLDDYSIKIIDRNFYLWW